VVAVVGPVAIIVGIYVRRRNVYDLHHAILGLLFSVLITAVLTDAIKDGVGRPRPNFFWRCFPDGLPVSSPVCSITDQSLRDYMYSVAAASDPAKPAHQYVNVMDSLLHPGVRQRDSSCHLPRRPGGGQRRVQELPKRPRLM